MFKDSKTERWANRFHITFNNPRDIAYEFEVRLNSFYYITPAKQT